MLDEVHGDENSGPLETILSAAFGPDEKPSPETVKSILRGADMSFGVPVEELTADLEDRYELLHEISRGGMGIVTAARDSVLGRRVAIKTLTEDARTRPAMVRRIIEEARICGCLEHPGIVPLHDFGFHSTGDPYLVMRLVDGETLAGLLRQRDGVGEDLLAFLQVFEQICKAAAYAHDRGYLHRDLKPSNVMVGAHGETQVMDWGLAKPFRDQKTEQETADELVVMRTLRRATGPGSIVGTAPYMAPEQARGDIGLDARCDVFALGSILLEIITGRPAFSGAGSDETLQLAAKAELQEAMAVLDQSDADRELTDLVRRCLSANREDRPADGGAVAIEVAGYLSGLEDRRQKAEVATAAAKASAAAEHRAHRLTVVLTIVVATVVVGAIAIWVTIDANRRARLESVDRRVSTAVDRARFLWDEARSARPIDMALWSEAVAAGHEAEAIAESGSDGEAGRVMAAITTERDAYAKTLAVKEQLDEVGPHLGGDRSARDVDAELRRLFLELEIDVDDEIRRVADRIRKSPIREELVTFLDDWTFLLMQSRVYDSSVAERLLEIAVRSDEHPWRNEIRRAVKTRDLDALMRLSRSGELNEALPESRDLLARSLGDMRDLETSIAIYREAVIEFPESARLAHHLGVLLTERAEPPTAEVARLMAIAVALQPDNAYYRADLGLALGLAGELDAANGVFDWLEANRPEYVRGWRLKGAFLLENDRVDDAIAAFMHATGLAPDSARAWNDLGSAQSQAKQFSESLVSFEKSVATGVLLPEATLNLGSSLSKTRRNREAVTWLRHSLELRPHQPRALGVLGAAYIQLGRYQEAIETLRALVVEEPDSAQAWQNLSFAYAICWDWEPALVAARRANALDDSSANNRYLVGAALFRLGHFEEATTELMAARDLGYRKRPQYLWVGVGPFDVRTVMTVEARREGLEAGESLSSTDFGVHASRLACLGRNAESTRAFQRLFEIKRPGLARKMAAARVALKAAMGLGVDAGDTDESDREAFLDQGIDWIEEIAPSVTRRKDRMAASRFLGDPTFRAFRSGPVFDGLDENERAEWTDIWTRTDSVLELVEGE